MLSQNVLHKRPSRSVLDSNGKIKKMDNTWAYLELSQTSMMEHVMAFSEEELFLQRSFIDT